MPPRRKFLGAHHLVDNVSFPQTSTPSVTIKLHQSRPFASSQPYHLYGNRIIRTNTILWTDAGCFTVLRRIKSIRRSLTKPVLQSLVMALVLSRLDYSSTVPQLLHSIRWQCVTLIWTVRGTKQNFWLGVLIKWRDRPATPKSGGVRTPTLPSPLKLRLCSLTFHNVRMRGSQLNMDARVNTADNPSFAGAFAFEELHVELSVHHAEQSQMCTTFKKRSAAPH